MMDTNFLCDVSDGQTIYIIWVRVGVTIQIYVRVVGQTASAYGLLFAIGTTILASASVEAIMYIRSLTP